MKIRPPSYRVSALVASIVAASLGGFGLGSWLLGQWRLSALSDDFIPMAPVTAVLFIALGLSNGVRLRNPSGRPLCWASVFAAVASALVSVAELMRTKWAFPLPWDILSFGVDSHYGVMTVGRMAPLTAACFLLVALEVIAQCPPLVRPFWFRLAGAAANVAVLLISALVLLAYAASSPFGYEADSIPMALSTALAFLALGLALLVTDRGGELWRIWLDTGLPDEDPAHPSRFFTTRVTFSLFTLLVAIGAACLVYLRSEQANLRHSTFHELESIAALKTAQITAWRNERLGDARVAAAAPDLDAFLSLDEGARSTQIQHWNGVHRYFESLIQAYAYSQIVLLDKDLKIAATYPAGTTWDRSLPEDSLETLGKARAPYTTELHRGTDRGVHTDVISPLRDPADGTLRGAVVMEVSAGQFLLPLLAKWPTASTTGETLLVRRDGDCILFLNNSIERKGNSLTLRLPMSTPGLMPANALARGIDGPVEGKNLRGAPSLGYASPVPGTNWLLITQVERAEAFAAVSEEGLRILASLVLILSLVGIFARSWWLQGQQLTTARQLVSERQARAASERFAQVMRHANDAILLYDDAMHILEANERALASYGRTLDEMRAMTARDLRTDRDAGNTAADFARALTTSGIRFETVHRRKDGSTFDVEVSARPVDLEGRRHVLAIIRDVTERKAQEHEIERLNRLYRVISHINQTLARTQTRDQCLRDVCNVLVNTGGFRLAWIGWLDPRNLDLVPVATAGDTFGYVGRLHVSADAAKPGGRGPSGTALRENRWQVCNDFHSDPSTVPWREAALQSGIHASICMPLQMGNRPAAVLCVYSEEKGYFADAEIELMREIAADLSHALAVIAGEQKRREAEASLQISEERFRALFQEIGSVAIQGYAADGTVKYWNKASEQLYGYPASEAIGRNLLDLIIPDEMRNGVKEAVRWMIETGAPIASGELTLRRSNGSPVHVYSSHALIQLPGLPAEFFCVDVDISERIHATEALRESKRMIETIINAIPARVFWKDSNLRYLGCNQAFADDASLASPADIIGKDDFQLCWHKNAEAYRTDDFKVIYEGQKKLLISETQTTPAGGNRHLITSKLPLRDASGNTIGVLGTYLDVTELKDAEATLLRHQAYLAAIAANQPGILWLKDADCRLLYVNEEFARVSGRENPAALIGLTDLEIWPADRARHYMADDRRVMASKSATTVEEQILTNGELKWFETFKAPILDQQGQVIGTTGYARDITERKLAEAALRDSEKMLRESQIIAGLGSYVTDFATSTWRSSEILDRVFGIPPAPEHTLAEWGALIHPEDRAAATSYLQNEVFTQGQPFDLEYRIIRPSDGEVRWMHGLGELERDDSGRPVKLRGTVQDINERKLAESRLERSRSLLSATLESTGDGILVVSSSGEVTSYNQLFLSLWRVPEEVVLKCDDRLLLAHVTDQLLDPDNFIAGVKHLYSHPDADSLDELVFKDGRIFERYSRPQRIGDTIVGRVWSFRNITGRKLAEKKLRQLSSIVEQAPLAIAITNTSGVIEYVNPCFTEISGYPPEEAIGQNPRILKSGLTPPETYRDMWSTLNRGEIWRGELNNKRKNGELYDELAVITPITDPSGKVTHFAALKQDITERKAAENALRESERRFRELFDLESDAILVVEAESGCFVQANEAACSTYGYPLSDFLRLNVNDISAEPAKTSLTLVSATQTSDQVIKIPQRLHRKRDGTIFPVELSIRTFQRSDQLMLVAVIRDISEQVWARERLERFNAELESTVARRTDEIARRNREIEALLQSIPDLVMRMRSDETLLDLKPAKGSSPLSSVALPDAENLPSPSLALMRQAAAPLGRRALAENTTVVAEVSLPLGPATVVTELRAAPVGAGEFVVFARDITERKLFESAMVTMLEKERQISEMKTRFISVTSHEFRTPMAAAMASADLLRNHLDHLTPAKREELFNRIGTSLHRMTQMLDDVLLLNRIDAQRVEVNLTPVDLADFTRNVIDEIRLGDRDAHQFDFVATGLSGRFPSDTNLLHHILGNLLSNAVRYSPAGTVISVGLAIESGRALLSVRDRGIGIPEADRSRIFESFERGSNVGTIKGTGLGLNIVKRMTDLLDGTITLEPPAEGGSRFILTLPRKEQPPAARTA